MALDTSCKNIHQTSLESQPIHSFESLRRTTGGTHAAERRTTITLHPYTRKDYTCLLRHQPFLEMGHSTTLETDYSHRLGRNILTIRKHTNKGKEVDNWHKHFPTPLQLFFTLLILNNKRYAVRNDCRQRHSTPHPPPCVILTAALDPFCSFIFFPNTHTKSNRTAKVQRYPQKERKKESPT